MGTLDGRRVAILATDGVEEVELTEPRDAVTEAGATAEIVSLDDGEIQAMNGDIQPAGKYRVDRVLGQAEGAMMQSLKRTTLADLLRSQEVVTQLAG